MALAYFITFTTYGTRLHGCEDAIDLAVHYTLNEQGERMAWYAKDPRTQ